MKKRSQTKVKVRKQGKSKFAKSERAETKKVHASSRRDVSKEFSLQFVETILIAIITDAFQTLPLYKLADFQHDVSCVKRRLKAEGLSFATKTITCLSQGLFDHLEGRVCVFPTFKLWDRKHPVFLKGLFVHAMGLSLQSRDDHDFRAGYIRAIYQFSSVFKKLKGPYKKSVLAKQYADFVKVDESLSWPLAESEVPILRRARYLCSRFIEGLEPLSGYAVPRPGPGATNTPTKKYERYEPRVLYRQVNDVLDYRDWFYVSSFDACIDAPSYKRLLKNSKDAPTSRFKFVPKTWAKARGICIEEFEVQWIQQGLRRMITKHINDHPLYKKRIVLHKQAVNAELALYGSRWRSFATLDMSEASDRVSRSLVQYLFQDNEELVDALMALSTRYIVPPKESSTQELLSTNKFAPMGSALCFPIMSLVHMMLIRAIIQLSSVQNPHLLSTQVYVYGDDIVLPSACVQAVYDWLPRFGMKLNETKSFYQSHFRESCGTHAYYGHDITPIFIREIPKHWQGNAIKSLVETEYLFHKNEWFSVARTIRDSLIRCSKVINRYVPCTSNVVGFKRNYDDEYVPGGMRFLKYSPKVKYNGDLQLKYRREWVFHSITSEVGLSSDYHAYLRWYAERPETRIVNDTADGVCLQKQWVPESVCQLGAQA